MIYNYQDIKNIDSLINFESVLLFDMDGTLVDTNLANFLAYKKAVLSVTKSDHNLYYNPEKRFNRSNLKNVIPNLSENQEGRIIQEKEIFYDDFLRETKLNNLILEVLIKYSITNQTVLVTNCRKDRALAILNYHGLIDKFNNIFFRQFSEDDEKINKYQSAISCLGISANRIIVFEDEILEINDAKMAGIPISNIIKI
jgi:beta-phosphoglucomutase